MATPKTAAPFSNGQVFRKGQRIEFHQKRGKYAGTHTVLETYRDKGGQRVRTDKSGETWIHAHWFQPEQVKATHNAMKEKTLSFDFSRVVSRTLAALIESRAHIATSYLAPNLIVRATMRLTNGKLSSTGNLDIRLTVGKPNSRERDFVKQLKKAGESFPVKKVQLKYPPKKR